MKGSSGHLLLDIRGLKELPTESGDIYAAISAGDVGSRPDRRNDAALGGEVQEQEEAEKGQMLDGRV